MTRISAQADPAQWVPITGSFGFRGRRARKKAIGMLLAQANAAFGREQPGSKVAAWAMSQAIPALMRRADGRLLAWVWKDDPELLVAMAQVQELTPQLRTMRASMPIEYDDTVSFTGSPLGVGEKLEMPLPPNPRQTPFASYTWDTGTHLVTLTAVISDRERFGTVIPAVDALARSLRLVTDLAVGEGPGTLRIDPA